MPDPAAFSLADAAVYLGVSKRSVERLLVDGAFRAVQYAPGKGHRRILKRDLDDWLEGLKRVNVEGRKVA